MNRFELFNKSVREIYNSKNPIPLHAPIFLGNEKKYLIDTIDTTFVSSIGRYVDDVESFVEKYTKSKKAIAVVNGTSGLQAALKICGVKKNDEVITQALTFVATANAISLNGASPIFIDVELDTMGMSPKALSEFLEQNCVQLNNEVYNKRSGKKISAVLPMHTFGFLCRIEKIKEICNTWGIPLIEDAAESFGSFGTNKASGTYGDIGVYSFNGNKILTSGGGGVIVTNNENFGLRAKHLTTTAKRPHPFEYFHDEVGYNFRMPNINASLLLAQLEQLEFFIESKEQIFNTYQEITKNLDFFLREPPENTCRWNYWLMSIEMENKKDRDEFLNYTNSNGIATRPIWNLLYELPMYSECYRDEQINAKYLEQRIVNIPSSAKI